MFLFIMIGNHHYHYNKHENQHTENKCSTRMPVFELFILGKNPIMLFLYSQNRLVKNLP